MLIFSSCQSNWLATKVKFFKYFFHFSAWLYLFGVVLISPYEVLADVVSADNVMNLSIELESSQPSKPQVSSSKRQPTLETLLGKKIVTILQSPDIAESYLVEPELAFDTSDKRKLAGFRITQNGSTLTADQVKQFQTIVFDLKNYSIDKIKKCTFRPGLGLLFEKDQQQVEFLLSVGCDKWLFMHGDQVKEGDYFESAKQPLLALWRTLFPSELEKGSR